MNWTLPFGLTLPGLLLSSLYWVTGLPPLTTPALQQAQLAMSPALVLPQLPGGEHLPFPDVEKEQRNLESFITQHYQVDHGHAAKVVQHAYRVGEETGLEPRLLLAVAAVESGFDARAENRGAKGLMQIQASAHRQRIRALGGLSRVYDIQNNLRLGAEILRECLARVNYNLPRALRRYNGSDRAGNPYPGKVLKAKAKLDEVAEQGPPASAASLS